MNRDNKPIFVVVTNFSNNNIEKKEFESLNQFIKEYKLNVGNCKFALKTGEPMGGHHKSFLIKYKENQNEDNS